MSATNGSTPQFSERLWSSIEATVIPKILEHPFIKQLQDGSLAEDTFKAYIVQDDKYLETFGRCLNMLAAAAPRSHVALITTSALKIAGEEILLHKQFLQDWGLSADKVDATPMQPACTLYTSYLVATVAFRPFHEGLAALLPCYWVYQHVGKHLKDRGSPNEKFQAWIDMYGGEEFDDVVQKMIELMDWTAQGLTPTQQEACITHFVKATQMEYMFWDGPFRGETWPC